VREAERIAQIHAEAGRRRDEQRQAAAAAVGRMHERGEKIDDIAVLAETTESEVRSYLKLARARRADANTVARSRSSRSIVSRLRSTVHHVLIAQAGRDGGVSKVVHRLHQIPDPCDLCTAEMPQVVYPNTLAVNGFQRRCECVADNFVGQVVAATNRREQERVGSAPTCISR